MRLTIFGGSTAAGLGVGDGSYGELVATRLGLTAENLAGSSAQVTDSIGFVDRAAGSQVVLVMHGSGEALVRPTDGSLRFMPPRWRRRGWMDPRAYYSRNRRKRIFQRIESAVRWRVKVALIRITGGQNIVPLDEYLEATERFIARLRELGVETIAFVGSSALDARYFPYSTERIAEYDRETRALAERTGCRFIEVLNACDRWDDYFGDHLHPNADGHAKLADAIVREISIGSEDRPTAGRALTG